MNRIIWLVLILASEALLPRRAAALLQPDQASPDDDIEVAVSSANGHTYLTTRFGRLPDGKLRPNCIEDKGIPLPINFLSSWQLLHYKRLPGGAPSDPIVDDNGAVIDYREVLIEPEDPVEASQALVVGDLLISNGPMAGKWSFKSSKPFKHGLLVRWTQADKSSLQTFIPWPGIFGWGIERSQFDAPLCRE